MGALLVLGAVGLLAVAFVVGIVVLILLLPLVAYGIYRLRRAARELERQLRAGQAADARTDVIEGEYRVVEEVRARRDAPRDP